MHARTRAAPRARSARRSRRFADNTIEHMREERELLAGKIELPSFDTDFRDRPALVVVRGVDHQRTCKALRPYIRDVQARARRRRRRRRRASSRRASSRT